MSSYVATQGTSSLPNIPPSSSAEIPPGVATTAQTMEQHFSAFNHPPGKIDFFDKWGVTIVGMFMSGALTGVVGYFSAIIPLKDNINDNKTEISVAKKDLDNIKEEIKRLDVTVGIIPEMRTEIAILRTKQDISDGKPNRK